jgi:hypothetical protein
LHEIAQAGTHSHISLTDTILKREFRRLKCSGDICKIEEAKDSVEEVAGVVGDVAEATSRVLALAATASVQNAGIKLPIRSASAVTIKSAQSVGPE